MRGLAALPDGGAIAAGAFDGELAAGAKSLTAAGGDDGFAIALSPAGEVRWAVTLGGTAGDELAAAAVSPRGEVAVAGFADGPASLGGSRLAGQGHPAAVVARLDPASGAPAWVRVIPASGYAVASALAWAGDDVVVAGYYGGTLDPAGAALHGGGALDLWVARLAGGDGAVRWIHRGGGPGSDTAQAIAVGADGGVLVAGSFTRWADLSSTHLAALDEDGDPFVARVGPDGFEWARAFTSEGTAVARAIAPLGTGVALAIEFDGHLATGYERFASAGATDLCLVALAPEGAVAWARRLGGPAADSAAGLWSQGDGRLLLTGSFSDALGGLESQGGRDGYAIALGARGAPTWQHRIGGAGDEVIAAGAARGGALLVGGSVADRFELGGASGQAAGPADAFVSAIPLPYSRIR